jgi:hypothetical protein
MHQLPVRDDTYTPINIPTVGKVITMTNLSWEETYLIQMFSNLSDIATGTLS